MNAEHLSPHLIPGPRTCENVAMNSSAISLDGAQGRKQIALIVLGYFSRTAKNHYRAHWGNPRGPRTTKGS